MEIKTKEYKISTNEIFIAYLRHYTNSLLSIFIIYLIGCYTWTKKGQSLLTWTIFILIVTLYYIIQYWWYAKKLSNGLYSQKKVLELKEGYLYEHYEDGSEVKIKVKNIKKSLNLANITCCTRQKPLFSTCLQELSSLKKTAGIFMESLKNRKKF